MANADRPNPPAPYVPMPIALRVLVSPPLFMASEIRAIDRTWAGAHPSTPLMARAGMAAAELAGALISESGECILVMAGPGNNGGDALVAARLLAMQGFRVTVVSRADPGQLPPDAAGAWAAWHESGGTIMTGIPPSQRYSLVIDGLFGMGLKRDIRDGNRDWIQTINNLGCPKLALDVPSGIDSDSGRVCGCALRADHTLTFLGLKPGLFTAGGPDHVGHLHLDTLGVDSAAFPDTAGIALTQRENRHCLPARLQNSHKGLFGHIAIIGGDRGRVGACLLAGRAALEHGAGSVTVGLLDERLVVDCLEPRLMFASPEALLEMSPTVLALGPGLGQHARSHALLETALVAACPLVLDADALNLLAQDAGLSGQAARRSHPTLLTPHPGEAGRLLGQHAAAIQSDRIGAARELSLRYHAHVALKGAGTVVAHPDGRYAINTTGGPWLAQAGSGDRLTGMVAALLGQRMTADDALEAAVWLHGAAPSKT